MNKTLLAKWESNHHYMPIERLVNLIIISHYRKQIDPIELTNKLNQIRQERKLKELITGENNE